MAMLLFVDYVDFMVLYKFRFGLCEASFFDFLFTFPPNPPILESILFQSIFQKLHLQPHAVPMRAAHRKKELF